MASASSTSDFSARCDVLAHLSRVAQQQPDRVALIFPRGRNFLGRRIYGHATFQQLMRQSDRYANGLHRLGITPGTRVLVMVPAGVELITIVMALLRINAVLILIDPGMGRANLLQCLTEVQPQALIGVPAIQLLSRLVSRPFAHVQHRITSGPRWWWDSVTLTHLNALGHGVPPHMNTNPEDIAAILFTTGSTGVPKGAVYLHGMLEALIRTLRDHFAVREDEVSLVGFLPFALVFLAMGATCVLPPMNPSKPASADPRAILKLIARYQVSVASGSPALWHRVSEEAHRRRVALPSIRTLLLFGAPVAGSVLQRVQEMIAPNGSTYTPYGATEVLAVTSLAGSEILGETLARTQEGAGVCVGRPFPELRVRIIRISDEPIPEWRNDLILPVGAIGEIVVSGALVTREYYNRPEQTALAKIRDGHTIWHRMGDLGYLDAQGRLWFCGRKGHRVVVGERMLFTIPCEAIFNQHPNVFRSALVGVGPKPRQRPVVVIEPARGRWPRTTHARQQFIHELLELGRRRALTREIRDVLFHPHFPVDYRHNAKILREQLAAWAERVLQRHGRMA